MSDLRDCFKSNVSNPFGNYINVGNKPIKKPTCNESDINKKVYNFQGSMLRPNELYYTETFNRNFNTNPVTQSSNDQTGFAKFLYPNTSQCRDDGYSCKINSSISKGNNRIVVQSDYYMPNYLDIFGVYDSYK